MRINGDCIARAERSDSGDDLDAKSPRLKTLAVELMNRSVGVHQLVHADARAVPSPRDALQKGKMIFAV